MKLRAPITGLVLTGGGARAAYQVGALRALAEVLSVDHPFQVVAGASAGAINCAGLAAQADDFRAAVSHLLGTWRSLSPDQVFRTDVVSLMAVGAHWLGQLGTGGLFGAPRVNALLDTTPLRGLLERTLQLERIPDQVARGHLRGAAITATSYHTGTAITFYEGAESIAPWVRSTRIGVRASLRVPHVLASSAIPVFFPPVAIDQTFYGDGCIRLSAPLSPAIHLGAERLLAIGVRYARTPAETIQLNETRAHRPPAVSEISGVLLNAIFLDSLESDIEQLERINVTHALLTEVQRSRLDHPLRTIPLLTLRPSRDLGSLAVEQYRMFPKALRHLLRGIGATGEKGWDLVSYLAFEPAYIERLLELGYDDTRRRRSELQAFFEAPSERGLSS